MPPRPRGPERPAMPGGPPLRAVRVSHIVEDPVSARVAVVRLEQVAGTVLARLREAGLLPVHGGAGEVALGEPGRDLVAEDGVYRRGADVDLTPPVVGRPVHGVGRDLRLVDGGHGHRVFRHLRAAMAELGRVQARQLHHRYVDARSVVAQLRAQRLDEALDRVLGPAVRSLQGDPAVGHRRAHLHDRAADPGAACARARTACPRPCRGR